MSPAAIEPLETSSEKSALVSRFPDLRGVCWRIYLGILPSSSSSSSSFDDFRRVTADSRRRYAGLRRRLLVDPQIQKDGSSSPNLAMDNPLSQNPDSMWGRFFRNAELEKMVDQDLSRLYPEHGSYFQTSGCQGVLRRILLIWCLRHPEYGYRQGMHELLAPLVYVLHSDLKRLSEFRKLYEEHFTDKLDDIFFHEGDFTYNFDFRRSLDSTEGDIGVQEKAYKVASLDDLDPSVQTIVFLCDAYGAEGELGIILSEKFMEHDAYCMFDALMSGAGGAVAMAEFFSSSPVATSQTGLPPVIEASSALYHLLSIVDPSLHSHLVELGVEPQYFSLRWLRVLFGREFSLEDLLVIWDQIFSFDNVKSVKDAENDFGFYSGILNSHRGAFISAMAVAMMLSVRSSLLATENATSCLQRLLNFPENVDLNKLIRKAKSLMSIELDANISHLVVGQHSRSTSSVVGGHSHSFDSSAAKTPISSVPESYWEEKWRVLHDEEEITKENSTKETSSQKKGWTQRVRLRLSRSESDPAPSKREIRTNDKKSSIRRRLLDDLSQHLLAGDDIKESRCNESFSHEDPLQVGSVAEERTVPENLDCIMKTSSGESTATEENYAMLSDPTSPVSGSSFIENNETEKCNVVSSISHDVNDGEVHNTGLSQSASEVSTLPLSDSPNTEVPATDSATESSVMFSRERKSLSGKFQWFWKLGRHHPSEGTSDREDAVEGTESANGGIHQIDAVSPSERNFNSVNVKAGTTDQNLICTLRCLGQSMLENIQVIESVFQPDGERGGSLEPSKKVLVEKGQVTAMSAVKELRKVGNFLSEM